MCRVHENYALCEWFASTFLTLGASYVLDPTTGALRFGAGARRAHTGRRRIVLTPTRSKRTSTALPKRA
jgi:hypothetical protein